MTAIARLHPIRALLLATALALPGAPAATQDTEGLASFEVMTPDTAIALAQATLEACREGGY
ncbi:MAG: hypothetical protein AAF675_02130, partial [Pseudomonadota bacterium]